MSSKRMTANPLKPSRYRPGKPIAEEPSSDEDYESEQEEQQEQKQTAPLPKATSFPSDAKTIAGDLKKVDLNERRKQAAAEEAIRVEDGKARRAAEEEGFVTEEEEETGPEDESASENDSESGSGSGSEESSSEDEAPKKLLRPTFIKKTQRNDSASAAQAQAVTQDWAEEEARKKEKADAMIQEQLEKNALAKAAGKKDWDDDEIEEVDQVDDTDGLDPETERAAWKLRELKRVKREREAIEAAEKETEEVERRRNLGKEEREAEDKDFLEKQKEERDGRGQMGYMQKYFHKGAFFQDDAKAEGLDQRDIMGSRYADDVSNREILPEYMQIRDMTKLGRRSRTKYKDLKSEDTGRWGAFEGRGPRKSDGAHDERFMPDRDRGPGASGANKTQVGGRRRPPEGAPSGPRVHRTEYRSRSRRRSPRRRSYSRSRSPAGRNDRSFSRSPPRREYHRRRSYSYSRSPSPRRERYRDDHFGRKRSVSPHQDHFKDDKRRRLHAS